MKEFIKKNYKWLICLFIVFACSLILTMSGDDYDWATKSLVDFGSLIKDPELNGRYVGNFLVILITKNRITRAIFTSIIITGIVYLLAKETRIKGNFVWLLFLLMPLDIFVQSISWASGFTNYAISSFLLLIILSRVRNAYKTEVSIPYTVITCLLIFINSFFLENITIFMFVGLLILNIIYYIKKKEINWPLLSMLLVSLLGTILMFIQPTYTHVAKGEDFYREVPSSLIGYIKRIVLNYVYSIHLYCAFDNVLLLIVINICYYIYYQRNKKDYRELTNKFLKFSFGYFVLYLSFALLSMVNSEWTILMDYKILYVRAFMSTIFLLSFVITSFLLFYKREMFKKIFLPIGCIVLIVSPLIIVSPLGPRNFLIVYILEMLIAFYLLDYLGFNCQKWTHLASLTLGMVGFYFVSIYAKNMYVSLQRDNYIKYISEETTRTIIYVPLVPHDEFVHFDGFADEISKPKYDAYHNIRDDIEYVFVEYYDWVEEMKKEEYEIEP